MDPLITVAHVHGGRDCISKEKCKSSDQSTFPVIKTRQVPMQT
jgi:hypothetical protein